MFAVLFIGCGPFEPTADAPTWHADIAPIIETKCVQCHQEGQIAPFELESYDQVSELGAVIAQVTAERTMPPWGADNSGSCQTWRDAWWLTDAEISDIGAWVDLGMPEGEPALTPDHRSGDAEVMTTTHVMDMEVSYYPDSSLQDDYRCFIVDPDLGEDRFLTAYEVVPGDAQIVHHVILFTLDSEAAEQQVQDLDNLDERPGYSCFGSSLAAESRPIAGWAPGTGVTRHPDESGIRLLANRKMVLQVHYNLLGGVGPDRTVVNLELAEGVPREALLLPVAHLAMEVEPNQYPGVTEFSLPLANLGLPFGAWVRGVFPHMHQLGMSITVEVEHTDGSRTCVVDVPNWDFGWQRMYFPTAPLYVSPSDTVYMRCSYDTRDQQDLVVWGEGTLDEMCLVGILATFN